MRKPLAVVCLLLFVMVRWICVNNASSCMCNNVDFAVFTLHLKSGVFFPKMP